MTLSIKFLDKKMGVNDVVRLVANKKCIIFDAEETAKIAEKNYKVSADTGKMKALVEKALKLDRDVVRIVTLEDIFISVEFNDENEMIMSSVGKKKDVKRIAERYNFSDDETAALMVFAFLVAFVESEKNDN